MERLEHAQSLLKQLHKSLKQSQEFATYYRQRMKANQAEAERDERAIAFWENEIEHMQSTYLEAAE